MGGRPCIVWCTVTAIDRPDPLSAECCDEIDRAKILKDCERFFIERQALVRLADIRRRWIEDRVQRRLIRVKARLQQWQPSWPAFGVSTGGGTVPHLPNTRILPAPS